MLLIFRKSLFVIISLTLLGCASNFDVDSEIVNTPVHDDTKIFYLAPLNHESNNIVSKQPIERVTLYRPHQQYLAPPSSAVMHGDPVSIIVNKVILPRYLFDTKPEDPRDSKTYDIAVILDIASVEGEDKKSIAVFYQRGVKANSSLSFQDLLVYSQDNWDNRVPPYFRVRIFDVANERNERTKEILEQVRGLSGTIASIAGAPFAEPVIQVAARAAELVLLGDNEMLVDFQFQLYSSAQTSQSGGMPLGLFRKGGLAVVGIPRNEERQYWGGKSFQYDFSTEEIFLIGSAESSSSVDVPLFTCNCGNNRHDSP